MIFLQEVEYDKYQSLFTYNIRSTVHLFNDHGGSRLRLFCPEKLKPKL